MLGIRSTGDMDHFAIRIFMNLSFNVQQFTNDFCKSSVKKNNTRKRIVARASHETILTDPVLFESSENLAPSGPKTPLLLPKI